MAPLHVYSSMRFEGSAARLLEEGIAPHVLLQPTRAIGSVLAAPEADPALGHADIAFGQPDVAGVLHAPRLRWLQVMSAGFTRYDTPEFRAAAKQRGLVVTNSSSVFAEPCAEHVLTFMLAQDRQLPAALKSRCAQATPEWEQLRHAATCLRGSRAIILGYGSIAARLAAMLAPFAMKLAAMRREPRGDEGMPVVRPEELRAALAEADHVVSVLPDNADSRHFINAERLGWMKPGAVFYNIGRGTTVDQDALAAALHSGRLAAAWLDVTDPEPLPDGHVLLTAPNCHITPHIAGGHHREDETLVRHFTDNFRRFLANEPLVDRIM